MTLDLDNQLPPLHHHPHPHQQLEQQLLHRVPTACDRHPDELVTGFCASCLRERLAGLESQSSAAPRKSAASSAAVAALKSIFLKAPSSSSAGAAGPELRRCKSFSCGNGDGFPGPRASAAFEPQRRSCDVRGRSTLWSLFHRDDVDRFRNPVPNPFVQSSSSNVAAHGGSGEMEIEVEPRSLGFPPSCVTNPVIEAHEEDELDDADEITAVDPVLETTGEIEGELEGEMAAKPMKDHIDVENQNKKPPPRDLKEIAGSFWLAASVFSKKLQKWRRKQKLKKQCANGFSTKAAAAGHRAEKPLNAARRGFRDTQSEIAVDAFGRRSCDTDPRFSLDAGRISFDDPRFSWDEPRASWDGHLIGGRSAFPRLPPMVSVLEDPPAPVVPRWDGHIPVEEDSMIPGGTAQTKDYYLDSSSQRRRRSLDRSSSSRRPSIESNEPKLVSNAKVSPAGSTELCHGLHGIKLDRDSRELSSNSLRDDFCESFESAYRDPRKEATQKKSKRWGKGWSIWGFIHRRGGSRGVDGANVVERSFSESWPELRRQGSNGRILRSNSNVSSRHSFSSSGGLGSMRRSTLETNGHRKMRRNELVLERNRSGRYSPSHMDNGLLRFYLTPMGSRRNGGSLKNSQSSAHVFARSVLQMY